MRFFSGFSLNGEAQLFSEFLKGYEQNPYIVAGFSYGAINALEYVYNNEIRVDRLLLLSPSYFLNRSEAFKKAQKIYFKKDRTAYLESFLKNAAYPADGALLKPFFNEGSFKELDKLLHYDWPEEKLKAVAARGTKIEVYLGLKDKIVDAKGAHEYFKKFAQSYLFKPYGHILKGDIVG